MQDSHSNYSADQRVVHIVQTQGSCNFNLTSTGKGYIGKLLYNIYTIRGGRVVTKAEHFH